MRKVNKKQGMGWEILNTRVATIDKIPFNIDQLDKMSMMRRKYGKTTGALTKCPVCLYPTGILINTAKKGLQTRTCSQCNTLHKIRLRESGRYTIKNALGIIEVVNGEFKYRQAVNENIGFD